MYNCFTSLLHREKTDKSLQCDSCKELPLGLLSITNDHKNPSFLNYISIAANVFRFESGNFLYIQIRKCLTIKYKYFQ